MRDAGKAVLLVSAELEEIMSLADGSWWCAAGKSSGPCRRPRRTCARRDGADEEPLSPRAAGWDKPQVTPEQRRADIESCYRYVWSQVEHDMRIESDGDAARYDDDEGLGVTQLTKRMNLYEHRNQRTELINECMADKGYSRS